MRNLSNPKEKAAGQEQGAQPAPSSARPRASRQMASPSPRPASSDTSSEQCLTQCGFKLATKEPPGSVQPFDTAAPQMSRLLKPPDSVARANLIPGVSVQRDYLRLLT